MGQGTSRRLYSLLLDNAFDLNRRCELLIDLVYVAAQSSGPAVPIGFGLHVGLFRNVGCVFIVGHDHHTHAAICEYLQNLWSVLQYVVNNPHGLAQGIVRHLLRSQDRQRPGMGVLLIEGRQVGRLAQCTRYGSHCRYRRGFLGIQIEDNQP